MHGNTVDDLIVRISNVTSAAPKATKIVSMAQGGVHFLCETKHDCRTRHILQAEARTYEAAHPGSSAEFLFGHDVENSAGVAACLGPALCNRGR
eukprot:1481458-Prorocentrum_lima.AAC.1